MSVSSERDQLAKALADHFYPPHWEEWRKRRAHELPFDERYEKVWVEQGAEAQPHIHLKAGDGHMSFRAANCQEIAEAVEALGYRKPRTITRAEDLDAMPVWSVVLDGDGEEALQKDARGMWRCWNDPVWDGGVDVNSASQVVWCWPGPFTVLHEGAA